MPNGAGAGPTGGDMVDCRGVEVLGCIGRDGGGIWAGAMTGCAGGYDETNIGA